MKSIVKTIIDNYRLVLGVLITGLFLGWLFFHPTKSERALEIQLEGHEGHDHSSEDPTTWTCSMHPQIKQDRPGQCPICAMDLVPLSTVQSSGDDLDPNEIKMTESAAKLADVQTMVVSNGAPVKTVHLQGKVHADERNMAKLTARFGGRIEKLYVNFTGQQVRKGEKLATLYSPAMASAQRELIEAISFKETRPSFYTAARAKLKLWDLTDDQIDAIEQKGEPQLYFDVLSPISGTVMKRHVALGDYLKEGSPLFQVTDLSRVWILFDAYESDLPWISEGDYVEFSVQSLPGSGFEGRVSHIDPFINPSTRVAKVRIELPNKGLKLKPEMFASGVLHSKIAASQEHLLIPKTAVLWTGKRAVVYVRVPDRASPSFIYREITLGPEAGDSYVVAEGLREGETIAVNGVFKIDAAAQLEGKPSMMNPGGGKVSVGHDHGPMIEEESLSEEDHSEHQSMEAEPDVADLKTAFKNQLRSVYNSYIIMTQALVASDPAETGKAAAQVEASLKEVDMSLLEGEAHSLWMKQLKRLETEIRTISSASDISAQRIAFATFNDAFYVSLKAFGLEQGTVYYQYCPMANGDEGAYWFSNMKEIENPYFGDEMLRCGETREVLDFNEK